MGNSTIIHFVRHGEVYNPHGIYYGKLPGFHLSSKGKDQARSAASLLQTRRVAIMYSSPLERAIETAEILSGNLGVSWEKLDWLDEVHSPFDGKTVSSLAERHWDVYTDSGPEFEQPFNVWGRAQEFIKHCRIKHKGKEIIAVTHGDLIAFTTLWACRLPITQKEKEVLYKTSLTYASISSLTFETDSESEIPKLEYWQP